MKKDFFYILTSLSLTEVGKMKERRFAPDKNMESLDTVWVSQVGPGKSLCVSGISWTQSGYLRYGLGTVLVSQVELGLSLGISGRAWTQFGYLR